MSTVTNTQVAVKYRRNVGRLLIDMSADNQTTTLGQHIDHISVDCQSTYRPMLDRYVGWYVERHISVDISTDTRQICRLTYQPICRPIRWSTVSRYVGRGVHKIHMILLIPLLILSQAVHLTFNNYSTIFTEPEGNNCFSIISELNKRE